ncbi:MAG: hypothetical protein ABJ242_03985 [Marinomonas sp.]
MQNTKPLVALIAPIALTLGACQITPAGNATDSASQALGTSEVAQGLAFVQASCADCHAVEGLMLSPNPDAPTFASIANREGLTKDTLTTWLVDAHDYPAVMEFDLTPAQGHMIAQHMLTLKSPNYVPDN